LGKARRERVVQSHAAAHASLLAIICSFCMFGLGIVQGACPTPRHGWTLVWDAGGTLATDSTGAVYLASGFTGPTDFDPTEGIDERTSSSPQGDLFVSKLHTDGSYAWTYAVGGIEADAASDVATTGDGAVYVTGSFQDVVDFDPTDVIEYHVAADLRYNTFVTKLSSDGVYGWTRSFDGDCVGTGIAVDTTNSVVACGAFWGTVDFDPGVATYARTSRGFADVFVTKLSADGSHVWTRTFGGSAWDASVGVGVDGDGSVYVSGTFRGAADFDPGPAADWHIAMSQPIAEDIFITKFLSNGTYAWTRTLPVFFDGDDGDIAVSPAGDVVVTGGFNGTVDFDVTEGVDLRTAIPDRTGLYESDIFVLKLRSDGAYAWAYTAGGDEAEYGERLTIDAAGVVHVGGKFRGRLDFDPGPGVVERAPRGEFILRLGSDGAFEWVRTIDFAAGTRSHITTDAEGNIIYSGSFYRSVDVDPTCSADIRHPPSPPASIFRLTKLLCADPGDFDLDGDVDLRDMARFQTCFSGPQADACASGCDAFDIASADPASSDVDFQIDLADFAALAPLLTGPQ